MDILEVKEILLQAGTATVSDALDVLGYYKGLGSDINPLILGMKIAGPAYTLKYEEAQTGQNAIAGNYIDDVPAQHVIVIANNKNVSCTVFGDILAKVALTKGIEGTLIDGACRDVDGIIRLGYPVFSVGTYMKSGKGRVVLTELNKPIEISNTKVCPGDWIVADGSGAICIPQSILIDVIKIVKEIQLMEIQILQDFNKGMRLEEARDKNNYNKYRVKFSNNINNINNK